MQWSRRTHSLWILTASAAVAAASGCGQPRPAEPAETAAAVDPYAALAPAELALADPPTGECPTANAAACREAWQRRRELLQQLTYRQAEVNEVAHVYRDYGPLYIAETPETGGSPGFEELRVDQPWAGYWYPFRGDELYAGAASPLGKLDRVLASLGRGGDTARTERERHGRPDSDAWEGRCPSWALASVLSREPQTEVSYQGIAFSPADQKALLVLAHELYPNHSYGIRYLGNAATDGTYQSLRPEAFHRLFTQELGLHRRAFIINEASGVEVWKQPVYRVRWSVVKDPQIAAAYRVTALPFMIRSRTGLSEAPTSSADRAAPLYEYRLYVDPAQMQEGLYRVIAGEWLGQSVETHPHYVTIAEPGGQLAASNSAFNQALDVVRQIVGLP